MRRNCPSNKKDETPANNDVWFRLRESTNEELARGSLEFNFIKAMLKPQHDSGDI